MILRKIIKLKDNMRYYLNEAAAFKIPASLDEADNNLQKSEVISDLNDIDGEYQDLVRQAFCLGFTDFSVDKNRLFRPFDLLNSAEAVSMFLPNTFKPWSACFRAG